jgi:ribonuclease P/MRP protein subunit RPP40
MSPVSRVLSGVPQGSVLEPVLFILFINDIVGCMAHSVSVKLFADDAKIYTIITDTYSAQLQCSLDSIVSWANHWQLKLLPTKCTVMRLSLKRSVSDDPIYTIGDLLLPVVSQCTDLGVSYDSHLSFSSHIDKVINKASNRAKCILKCFSTSDSILLKDAFCTFVRQLLEYFAVIWCPRYKKDSNRIEAVQRSFIKSIGNLSMCSYRERLLNLGIDSLQCRRLKADLILCYKMIHDLVDIGTDTACIFTHSLNTFTCGNSFKLTKNSVASLPEINFYVNRIVNIWNTLPDSVVTTNSVASFKNSIDRIDFSPYLFF